MTQIELTESAAYEVKDMLEQQGLQLVEMLQQTSSHAQHPSLGNVIDISV